jgi:MOSC domain-containing protein YiiM
MISLGLRGRVEQIFIAGQGGAPMEGLASVEALQGCGLRGDRYVNRTGHWSGVDECQVTLIEAEVLERIGQDAQIGLLEGQHRRNIVTRGVRLHQLLAKHFAIGGVIFEYAGPRPPCAHLQTLSEAGTARALFGQRGGIGARVLHSGLIQVGDEIVAWPEWRSHFGLLPAYC